MINVINEFLALGPAAQLAILFGIIFIAALWVTK